MALIGGSEKIQKFADGIYGRSLEEFHLMIVTEVDGPLQRSIKKLRSCWHQKKHSGVKMFYKSHYDKFLYEVYISRNISI